MLEASSRLIDHLFLAFVKSTPSLFILEQQSLLLRLVDDLDQTSDVLFRPHHFQIPRGMVDDSCDEDEIDVGIVSNAKMAQKTTNDVDEDWRVVD